MLQRHAAQKFHGDERFTILFTNVENCTNVGVIQGRGSLRFTLKTGQRLRVSGNFRRQELQRNETAKAGVLCFVDHSHAATAKFFKHGVVGDGATDDGRSICHFAGQSISAAQLRQTCHIPPVYPV